jgi:hypothetical protein
MQKPSASAEGFLLHPLVLKRGILKPVTTLPVTDIRNQQKPFLFMLMEPLLTLKHMETLHPFPIQDLKWDLGMDQGDFSQAKWV